MEIERERVSERETAQVFMQFLIREYTGRVAIERCWSLVSSRWKDWDGMSSGVWVCVYGCGAGDRGDMERVHLWRREK